MKNHYNRIIRSNLINKFPLSSLSELPSLENITLTFSCRNSNLKDISTSLLALEILSNRKGKIRKAKKPNLLLKIRKGDPIACTTRLKKEDMYKFLTKLVTKTFPKFKDFKGIRYKKRSNKSISFSIKQLIAFEQLENHFYMFDNLPSLNVHVNTSSKSTIELQHLLSCLKFPFVRHKTQL